MFDSPYEPRLANKRQAAEGEPFLIEHKFTFSCKKNHQYIIDIEQYEYNFFVGKFYLKNHTNSSKKFQLLTASNDASRIIATCTKTLLNFYEENPYASFGFMGAILEGEALENTKRFRVYRRYIESIVSPVHFDHKVYLEKSCYLLINRLTASNIPDIVERIEKMFDEIYQFHDSDSVSNE
ncbi:MAG: hypothetical protein AAF798_05750 [Bacteroidota bacterium]